MCIHCNCLLIRSLRLASFKVYLCVIVLSVTICTVEYVCLSRRHQIFVYFVSFLCMIIYEVLYTYIITIFKVYYLQCLVFRYKNINFFVKRLGDFLAARWEMGGVRACFSFAILWAALLCVRGSRTKSRSLGIVDGASLPISAAD